jgi:hypothetical protein
MAAFNGLRGDGRRRRPVAGLRVTSAPNRKAVLREEVAGPLHRIRERAEARYVCIAEPGGVRFEAAEPAGTPWLSCQY